jgi:predicted heme/steroid binding protein/uncharacterized membrane protein
VKIFTAKEISESVGPAGCPALVVVDGKVYDVSGSARWKGGRHMNRHQAGGDLTGDLGAAPHGPEVLERVTQVGVMEAAPAHEFSGIQGRVEKLLTAYPFFRRHPHPAIVHYPIGLLTIAPVFLIAAAALGSRPTEYAAFLCVLVGAVTLPPAILTGYFTWWVNYEARRSPIIDTKRKLALIATILAWVLVLFRGTCPTFQGEPSYFGYFVYFALTAALAGLVGLVGFLGGKLTFPFDH